ncbi:hypothetical protein JXA12_02345 [Candidatus Woesearchaeota archaeon]|nr:hypothetical protein [Candidatus Woesearchaeota archaeon]
MREEVKKWFVLGVMLVLCLSFLLTPFVIRSLQGNHSLLGEESYAHLAIAQNILSPGSYPLPEVEETLYDGFLAILFTIAKPLLIGKLLPVALGVLAVILFFLRAGSIIGDEDERPLAGLLLLISPLFLVVFTSLSPLSLVLVLSLGAWFWYDRRRWVSFSLLSLLLLVDAKGFVVATLLLIAYGLISGEWKGLAVAGGAGLVVLVLLEKLFGFVAKDVLLRDTSSIFVSLGAHFGYSFFILFLALMGALASWSRKGEDVAASIIIIGVLLFSFSDVTARVLLLPVAALFAARGFLLLLRRSWAVQSIRNITLFLAGLSLLFTFVLAVSSLAEEEPSLATMEAMQFLRAVPGEEVVLSGLDNGVFIERIGRQPAFMDNLVGGVDAEARAAVAEGIFFSQRLEDASSLLRAYNISHILIDEGMRNGGVWTADDQGLLFLVENCPSFIKVYDKDGVSVYRFMEGEV